MLYWLLPTTLVVPKLFFAKTLLELKVYGNIAHTHIFHTDIIYS